MARRSTARAVARSRGGPETCGPGSCMAPYPMRATGRPARTAVPPGGSIRWWTVIICSLLSSQSGLRLSTLRSGVGDHLANVDVGRLVAGYVHVDAAPGGAHEPNFLVSHVRRILPFCLSAAAA